MTTEFWTKIEKDPFRIFFPLGAALAIAGIIPWAVQYWTHASYPRDLHRVLMINGFSLAFVCGFLMTAIPRFTGTNHATRSEVSLIFVLVLLAGIAAFFPSQSASFLAAVIALVGLMSFAGRRFIHKTSNPPYTFIFIGVGLLLWLLSNFLLFLNSVAAILSPELLDVSQDVWSNGAIMSLILGVGGRLIPGILGWQAVVSHQKRGYETQAPFLSVIPISLWIAVAAFVLSYFLKPFLPLSICLSVRLAVTVYFALMYWKLWKLPATRSLLTWNLWICCWCLALAYLFPLVWENLGVHMMHVLFIGGFSLLMLLISTRVSFAHSSIGTEAEKTSRSIAIFSSLILLAMLTRVTAILWPPIYLDHLAFAAIIWLMALCVWLWRTRLLARG